MLTPEQRSMRARKAAHAKWSKTPDRRAATKAATDAYLARFEREVDPDSHLPTETRRRLARSALTAHMTGLALRSSQARKKPAA